MGLSMEQMANGQGCDTWVPVETRHDRKVARRVVRTRSEMVATIVHRQWVDGLGLQVGQLSPIALHLYGRSASPFAGACRLTTIVH